MKILIGSHGTGKTTLLKEVSTRFPDYYVTDGFSRPVIKIGKMLDEVCNNMGLIVRPLINMCVFSPPLIISKSQIDDMFNILEQAIVKVSAEFN